jgi:hypothetical protein
MTDSVEMIACDGVSMTKSSCLGRRRRCGCEGSSSIPDECPEDVYVAPGQGNQSLVSLARLGSLLDVVVPVRAALEGELGER